MAKFAKKDATTEPKKPATKKTAAKKTVAKKTAAKKTVAKKAAPEAVNDNRKIKVLVKENPKREGTAAYDRFELYSSAKTVQEFKEAGGKAADLAYDEQKGFIEVK